MQKFPNNWDIKTKIDFLQRKIIFNSIIYYRFNNNRLSDKEYDEISRQLVSLYKEFDGDIKTETQYGYAMYNFDGTTGFDLYDRLTDNDKEYLTKLVINLTKHC